MPKIYAGSLESPWQANNLSNLKNMNFSDYNAILFCSLSTTIEQVQQNEKSFKQFNDVLIVIIEDVNDYEDYDMQTFNDAPSTDNVYPIYQFLQEHRNENIFVACSAGLSRTGAIVDYLIYYKYVIATKSNQSTHMIPNPTIQRLLSEIDNNYQPHYLSFYKHSQTMNVDLPEIKF